MSFIIVQDWSLRLQISEPPCEEFSLNVKALNAESSYLNSKVMMLYCHTMMLYHSVILSYLLYGDLDSYWAVCIKTNIINLFTAVELHLHSDIMSASEIIFWLMILHWVWFHYVIEFSAQLKLIYRSDCSCMIFLTTLTVQLCCVFSDELCIYLFIIFRLLLTAVENE